MLTKNINRQLNDKIKELSNQLNTLNSNNEDIKLKYEKQLKINIDLKKQQEKS